MNYAKEHNTIKKLFPKILRTADFYFGNVKTVQTKSSIADIFTKADTELDNLTVNAIKKAFPDDTIASEESSGELIKDLKKTGQRGWILDPLCGSANFSRRIKMFASNIIFINKGRTEAAWVVDHTTNSLIWSVGDKKIYVNNTLQKRIGRNINIQWTINVDVGYWPLLPAAQRKKYAEFIKIIMQNKHIWIANRGTSLAFVHVATGQAQAATTPKVKPWDLLAAAFLVEQNGGIASHFDGSAWGIDSTHILLAQNKKIYDFLIKAIKKTNLT